MNVSRDDPPLLDAAHAAFIQGGVSIIAASHRAPCTPVIARAAACRVSPDRRKVTLLIAVSQAESLLEGVRSTRTIAVVFSQPSTHRTIQLKGVDAQQAPLQEGDHELINGNVLAFSEDCAPLGYREEQMRALLWSEPGDFVAVSFTISAAFSQTPGPRAGEPLKA